jgi:DNA helicase-2/ATP-dependent DNA helicase PcrA
MVAAVISCVYCGGAHARPADVRRCWAERGSPQATDAGAGASGPGAQSRLPEVDGPAPSEAETGWVARRGPAALGRNLIVASGGRPLDEWAGCRTVVVDAAADPAVVVAELRAARADGESLVIELATELRYGEIEQRPQHELGPGHTLFGDELAHLVTSNAVDGRRPVPSWPAVAAAVRFGATVATPDVAGDVVLPSGEAVWLDGGPIRHHDPIDGVAVLHVVQLEHGRLEPPASNVSTAPLAPDQRAAVEHPGGSARIIAPAGSGKTRVLTERARHLLRVWHLAPSAVSLVAFNKRAQEEMRARTDDLPGLEVRTLNSIALAIINGVPPFARQPTRWRTIDEGGVRAILQRFVQRPRKLNVDPLAPWIDALSTMRLGLLDPALVAAQYGGDVDGLPEVWAQYREALEREGSVDFDDQIRRAIDVVLRQPEARAAAQRACRVLLVDEFQDLTPAHMLLVRLLAGAGGSVFGVGDDDQTIYGYNGADPSWLIDFDEWFPGAGDHPLEVNYRCPADVVEIADRLLRHNRRRVAKSIRADAAPGASPGWSVLDDEDPVAATVAHVSTVIDGGRRPADVAVLTRVNATLAPVQLALGQRGVPIASGVGSEFTDRVGVRAALAWLRLACGSTFRGEDLGEATRRPSRGFSPRLREWVTEQPTIERLERLADRLNEPKDASRVTDLARDLERLRRLVASGADTERVMSVLIDEIGLGGAVASLDANRHGMNRGSQSDDMLALRQIARLHPDPRTFEQWLRQALIAARDPDGAVLSTIHRVKGQEWPHVVVHLARPDQFPHRLSEDFEEERRLFHVAITRASRDVAIVTGGRPSEFVAELTTEPAPQPSHRPAAAAKFSPGPAPVARSRGAASAVSAAPDHPLLERNRVMAVIGLVLVDQGQHWPIVELEPAAAVTAAGNGAIRKFALGEKVETAGRQRGALSPRPGLIDEASVRLFDLLRGYRDRVRDGKPAYTVFDDKTLAAIATVLPIDLAELAAVKGVGPAKLEQYGDDVLELTAAARATPVASGEPTAGG